MKKLFITLAFAIVSTVAFSQIKVGGLIGFGSDTEKLALGVNGEIFVMDKLAIAPSFYFMGSEKSEVLGTTYKTTLSEINADVHYYFVNKDAFGIYGLAGLNLAFVSMKVDDQKNSDNDLGINFGAGASFMNNSKFSPYVEIKYETVFEQAVFGAGVRFPIKSK